MSADSPALPTAACPDCARLHQAVRPMDRPRPDAPGGAPRPLSALARHLANRHLDLVPGWVDGCDRCDEVSTALREAADQGLLGAGAAQAGAEHRALHLLTAPDGRFR
ncbi:hypothetical protein LG634_22210 [Streptomyces bambusae]|uniref:hypothetical protein n=1 Tax=Streptomyces bambusae TaxID=1550616 RepID=UPI001CFE875B|nr:hypothetical protein [Streptomyces bambusae]MCB5167530.1 hypothetical protein [Streptomyces bambusae]